MLLLVVLSCCWNSTAVLFVYSTNRPRIHKIHNSFWCKSKLFITLAVECYQVNDSLFLLSVRRFQPVQTHLWTYTFYTLLNKLPPRKASEKKNDNYDDKTFRFHIFKVSTGKEINFDKNVMRFFFLSTPWSTMYVTNAVVTAKCAYSSRTNYVFL